jgi:hypothetical protein
MTRDEPLVIEVKLIPRVLSYDIPKRQLLVGLFSESGVLCRKFWVSFDPDGGGGEPLPVEEVA